MKKLSIIASILYFLIAPVFDQEVYKKSGLSATMKTMTVSKLNL